MISEKRSGTRTTRISRTSCAETIHSGAVASRWKSGLRACPTKQSFLKKNPLIYVGERIKKKQSIRQSIKETETISENKLNTKQAARTVKLASKKTKAKMWTHEFVNQRRDAMAPCSSTLKDKWNLPLCCSPCVMCIMYRSYLITSFFPLPIV